MRREIPAASHNPVPLPTNARTVLRQREPTIETIQTYTKPVIKPRTVNPPKMQETTTPRYHSFVYDTGSEKTKVQIQMPLEQR